MECFICGADVKAPRDGWDALNGSELQPTCSAECRAIVQRYARSPLVTSSLSIAEERNGLNRCEEVEAEGRRWRLASAVATTHNKVRLQRDANGQPYLIAACPLRPGEEVLAIDPLFIKPPFCCTPTVVQINNKFIVCTRLKPGDVVTTGSTKEWGLLCYSTFGCSGKCLCSVIPNTHRTLPCPLSSVCHRGRCVFSCRLQRWECLSCNSFWSTDKFMPLTAELRCKEAALTTAALLCDDAGGPKPLTKATFEGLKRLLSALSDAGIDADHRLYSFMCQQFVEYFLRLAQTMKGEATKEFIAKMAILWSKLLLKSALLQRTTWQHMGWYIGKIAAAATVLAIKYPTLHTECIHLIRFINKSGYTEVYGKDKGTAEYGVTSQIVSIGFQSMLALTYSVCEQWLASFADEPSDLQRCWEDYLLSMAAKAISRNQLSLDQLHRSNQNQ